MIEIVFDKHKDNTFKNQEYPLLSPVDLKQKPFKQYLRYAKSAFEKFSNSKYLIVFEQKDIFDTNKLALAFFIASCFNSQSSLECLVIKTNDEKKAFNSYKPYIALSIAIKYALRVCQEDTKTVYKELETLNYLNFSIHKDFANKTLIFKQESTLPLKRFETNSLFDAIAYVSHLKFLSLAEIKENIELIVKVSNEEEKINSEEILEKILEISKSYISL